MNKYDVVVARYNENVDWVSQFDSNRFRLCIYNKGLKDLAQEYVQLENLGREAHTFLYYIIKNYGEFPEFVVFLQGDIEVHCKEAIKNVLRHQDEVFFPLADRSSMGSINEIYGQALGEPPLPYQRTSKLRDFALELLENEMPPFFHFIHGAQFIVSKNLIQNRSREFYSKVFEKTRIDFSSPWHLERMWEIIFKV
jgi:hypothetical protein